MADYSWIGPLIQAGAGYMSDNQRIGGAQQASDIQKDAYLRALALLQGGGLQYKPAQASMVGSSAMQNIVGDPTAELAQRDALMRLQEAARSGYDTIDRAAMNRTLAEANTNERMQREAALSRLDPGSGAAIAARLSAQQSGANRANQQALDVAAASRQRALQALGAFGNMASTMRGQGFDEAAQRAKAQDAIAKFNAETSQFNAGQSNAVTQSGITNQLNALNLAGGAGSQYGQSLSDIANRQAAQTQGVGTAISGGFNAYNESQKKKKEEPEEDESYKY